jgi:hypothetical protein
MQVETFIRTPQKVVAMQWFPYRQLPEVSQQTKTFDALDGVSNPTSIISSGRVLLNGKPWQVDPADYVIYDIKTMKPIQVVTEAAFCASYMSTKAFCLCSECEKKAEIALNPAPITSLDEIEKIILDGRGPVPLKDGEKILMIYTVEQLKTLRDVLTAKAAQELQQQQS